MPRNSGLHKPNAFLCPKDVITLAPKLTRDELLNLLKLLAGEEVENNKLIGLRDLKILDENYFFIWVDTKETIRLVREKVSITNTEKVKAGTVLEMIDTLTPELKQLWEYYVADLSSKHLTVTEGHFTNWLKAITDSMTHPNYDEVLKLCLDRKIGSHKYMTAILNSKNKKPDTLWEDVG
jgi:hypothetical protein